MEAVVQAPDPATSLDLAQIHSLPKVDTAIKVRVARVLGSLVLVSCDDKRTGVLDLEDTHNRELRARKIRGGDTLEVFIVKEDKSGNLLLTVKSPDLDDPWLQRHQVGTEIEGKVAKKADEFIQVNFSHSTSGRIYRRDLPPDVHFDDLSNSLRINQAIPCKVLGVFSRLSKKLILTLAEGSRR
jgi:ribosomal protein S1